MILPVTQSDIDTAHSLGNGHTALDVAIRCCGWSRKPGSQWVLCDQTLWVLSDETMNDEGLPHAGPWEAVLLPAPEPPRIEYEMPLPFGRSLEVNVRETTA